MQNNPVVFWELASNNMEISAQFFKKVFGWKIDKSERLGFYIIPDCGLSDGSIDGGIFTLKRAKLPFLTIYIQVMDIAKKAREIEENGGLVVEAPFKISSGSKICLFNEPSGVTFAMIETVPGKE